MSMTKKMRELSASKAEAVKQARAIVDAADAEGVDLTGDNLDKYNALMTKIDSLNAAISREQNLMAAESSAQGLEIPDGARIEVGDTNTKKPENHGFHSFGEFAKAVMNVTVNHSVDQRLNIGAAAPTTYGNEGTGADGGFLVPPEYSREIWRLSTLLEEGSFVPLTDNMPINGNSMTFPSDETTPWGTDGVRAYWEDEAAAATQTKPVLKPNTMRLKKLMALVPVTDELLSDSSGLPAYLSTKVAESIRWKTNDAIINGSGVGRPLGMLTAASLVTQAKVSGQTADTINATNVVNMFARLLRPGRGTSLINPDAWNQLPLMTIGDQPVFLMPNGLQSAPGGILSGRPVMMSDTMATLGNANDIGFFDFGMYRTITKAGGMETATSMHLYFDAAATAFRTIFRIDGQPILSTAVTPPNSAVTRSCAVTLAERA